jgi:hypothetical protein
MTRRPRSSTLSTVYGSVGLLLVALAVVREVRRPPELRTWHGEVLGFVPYDLRPPTLARVRAAWWAPDDRRLLLPRVLGVGWSVNLGRLAPLAHARPARHPPPTHRTAAGTRPPGGDRAAS